MTSGRFGGWVSDLYFSVQVNQSTASNLEYVINLLCAEAKSPPPEWVGEISSLSSVG